MNLNNSARVFVYFPSRDDEACQGTLEDLFSKALHPSRVFVGVCRWSASGDDSGELRLDSHRQHVRSVGLNARDGHWPEGARAQAQALWHDEEYVLQISDNTRFAPGWDVTMRAQLAACTGAYPVLTVSPLSGRLDDHDDHLLQRVQGIRGFIPHGQLRFGAYSLEKGLFESCPLPTAACDMGFIFGPASIVENVPLDPHLDPIEAACGYAVRLWTHGYDLFSPSDSLLFRQLPTARRLESDIPPWRKTQSGIRLLQLLDPTGLRGLKVDLDACTLGQSRSLEQFERFSGVDFSQQTVAPHARAFPFVYDHPVFADLARNVRLENWPRTELFLIGEGGLLFSENNGSLHILNSGAAHAWCALEDGQSVDSVRQQQRADFSSQAFDRMMLAMIGSSIQRYTSENTPQPELAEEVPAPIRLNHKTGIEHSYALLNTQVRVRYGSSKLADTVHPVLAHLWCAPTDRGQTIDLYQSDDEREYSIWVDGKRVYKSSELLSLAPEIKYQVMTLALKAYDHMLNVHAGVVARDNACLLLPGVKGSGKTSLVTALVAAGFRYLSDEVAPLKRTDCSVRPVPLSVCVKESATQLLAKRFPKVKELTIHHRQDGMRVRYLPMPALATASVDRDYPIRWVIFPRYRKSATNVLRPMDALAGIKRLVEEAVAVPQPLTLDDVACLAHQLERVDYFELDTGSLDGAVKAITGITGCPEVD